MGDISVAEHFIEIETLFQSYVYTLKLILSLHYCKRRNKEFLGLCLDIKPQGEKLSRRDLWLHQLKYNYSGGCESGGSISCTKRATSSWKAAIISARGRRRNDSTSGGMVS